MEVHLDMIALTSFSQGKIKSISQDSLSLLEARRA